MFNAAPFNSLAYNSAPVEAALNEWPLSLAVTPLTITPEFGVALSVYGTLSPQFALSLAVVDRVAITDSPAYAWSRRVTLGGVDVSARLLGSSRIDAEANAATIAQVSLRAAAGVFDPAVYQGAEVEMTYVWIDPAGVIQFSILQFIGQVDTFALDIATAVVSLTCSDHRKGLLLGADQATIAAMLPGSLWSAGVFHAEVDGLRYAEDRLSTLCADFDLLPDGSPVLTPWEAKATPDWTITRVVDGSLTCEFARGTDLVHRVEVGFDFRFARLRLRETRVHYQFDLGDLFSDSIAPPASSTITEALTATGWEILQAPTYVRPSSWYLHGGVYYGVDDENGTLEASARIGKRFAQSVDEHYTLTVSSSASGIDARLKSTLSGALEATFDASAWESDINAAPILPAPGWGMESALDATTDPMTGRAGADNAIRTLLAMSTATIRASHRKNSVTFDVPLNPFITRADTVLIQHGSLQARGKVERIAHDLDPASGTAKTTLTLAISRPVLSNPAASDAHTPPASPVIPAPGSAVVAAHQMELGNYIGGKAASPAYDEAWSGYLANIPSEFIVDGMITNWSVGGLVATGSAYGDGSSPAYSVSHTEEPASKYSGAVLNPLFAASTAYPQQFRIVAPEVEPAARDNLTVEIAADYLVRIPADLFTFTL